MVRVRAEAGYGRECQRRSAGGARDRGADPGDAGATHRERDRHAGDRAARAGQACAAQGRRARFGGRGGGRCERSVDFQRAARRIRVGGGRARGHRAGPRGDHHYHGRALCEFRARGDQGAGARAGGHRGRVGRTRARDAEHREGQHRPTARTLARCIRQSPRRPAGVVVERERAGGTRRDERARDRCCAGHDADHRERGGPLRERDGHGVRTYRATACRAADSVRRGDGARSARRTGGPAPRDPESDRELRGRDPGAERHADHRGVSRSTGVEPRHVG